MLNHEQVWALERPDGWLAQMPRNGMLLCFASKADAKEYRRLVAYRVPMRIRKLKASDLNRFNAFTSWRPEQPLNYSTLTIKQEQTDPALN